MCAFMTLSRYERLNRWPQTLLASVITTLFIVACGQGDSGGPGEPGDIDIPDRAIGLLPANWTSYRLIDVGRIMDEDREEYTSEFEDTWGDTLDQIGIFIDELAVQATVRGQWAEHVHVLQGEFDFDAVRDELSDSGMEEGEYRGFELWEGDGVPIGSEIALIEDGGFVLIGYGGATTVLQRLSRQLRLLEYEDESGVNDLLGGVGDGWHREVRIGEDCLDVGIRRCEGVAWAVTSAGRGQDVEVTWAFAFGDERSASRELDNVEDMFNDVPILDVQSSRTDGRLIVLSGTLDEKDWQQDGMAWASVNFTRSAVPTAPTAAPGMRAPLPAPTAGPAIPAAVPAAAPAPSPIGPQGPMVASIEQDSNSCIVVRFTEEVITPPGLLLQTEREGSLPHIGRADVDGQTPVLELRFGKYGGTDDIARGAIITSFVYWARGGFIQDLDGNDVTPTFEPYTVPADITCAVTR